MDEIRFIGEWSIVKKERQGGSSRRGTDIYINGYGKKCRSNRDLALHIEKKNLWDKIDVRKVNFYDLAKTRIEENTLNEFVRFVESKGQYRPKFVEREPKKRKAPDANTQTVPPLKLPRALLANMAYCDQCTSFEPKSVLLLADDGLQKCHNCRTEDPHVVLDTYFANKRILPTAADLVILVKQTNLEEVYIKNYIQPLMFTETNNDNNNEESKDNAEGDNLINDQPTQLIKQEPTDHHPTIDIGQDEDIPDFEDESPPNLGIQISEVRVKQEPVDEVDVPEGVQNNISIKQEPIDHNETDPLLTIGDEMNIKEEPL